MDNRISMQQSYQVTVPPSTGSGHSAQPEQHLSGQDLNGDVLTHVFLQLPPKDLAQARLVNRNWRAVTNREDFVQNFGQKYGECLIEDQLSQPSKPVDALLNLFREQKHFATQGLCPLTKLKQQGLSDGIDLRSYRIFPLDYAIAFAFLDDGRFIRIYQKGIYIHPAADTDLLDPCVIPMPQHLQIRAAKIAEKNNYVLLMFGDDSPVQLWKIGQDSPPLFVPFVGLARRQRPSGKMLFFPKTVTIC